MLEDDMIIETKENNNENDIIDQRKLENFNKYINEIKYGALPNHKIVMPNQFGELIKENYSDEKISAIVGSSYPLINPQTNEKDRLGDPICDSFLFTLSESMKIRNKIFSFHSFKKELLLS